MLRLLQLQVHAASWRVQKHSDTHSDTQDRGIAIPNSPSVNQHLPFYHQHLPFYDQRHPFYVIFSTSSFLCLPPVEKGEGRVGEESTTAHHIARTTHCVGERARGVHIPQEKEKERVREAARSGLGERVERARERVYASE